MNKDSQVTLITHSDLDGVGCAVLVKKAFGGQVREVVYADYHNIDEHVIRAITRKSSAGATRLIISDICPSRNVIEDLVSSVKKGWFEGVVLFDHHKTTAWLSDYKESWLVHDESACGTLLVQRWLKALGRLDDMDGPLHFASTVDAYDRWLLDSDLRPRSEQLNRLLWFLGFDRFVKEFVGNWYFEGSLQMRYIDECLREREERTVASSLKECHVSHNHFQDREGRTYLMCATGGNVSKVAQALLASDETISYVAVLNTLHNKVELRARTGGVDVAEIAKRNGGGGHAAAAGFPYPFLTRIQEFARNCF